MTRATLKRFWTAASAAPEDDGWSVRLDARPLRTPAGRPFNVPSRALAEAAAAEWDGAGEAPDPRAMPVTRSVNTALDRVAPHAAEVAKIVADYGASDLLCYRAPHPQELTDRQAAAWDPLLDWAEARYGARLTLAEGVMHVAQPGDALAALAAAVADRDAFRLAALHELTVLSGSLVIALAVAEGERSADDGWRLSRVDEDYQTETWGEDAEAAELAALKRADFLTARRLLDFLDA